MGRSFCVYTISPGGSINGGVAYKLDSALARLLQCQCEGCLKTSVLLLEHQECLMRPLCLAAIFDRERDLQSVRLAELHGFLNVGEDVGGRGRALAGDLDCTIRE